MWKINYVLMIIIYLLTNIIKLLHNLETSHARSGNLNTSTVIKGVNHCTYCICFLFSTLCSVLRKKM